MSKELDNFKSKVEEYTNEGNEKIEVLKNLDLFVIDNSLRETTVGSLKGHTIESKREIYEEVKKCSFDYFIVEAFNNDTRIGDQFLIELNEKGEDLSRAVAFSEVWDVCKDKVPQQDIPIGMRKCKEFKVDNIMFEMDLTYYKIDYEKFTVSKACNMLQSRIDWVRAELSKDSKIWVNIRDFSDSMQHKPERVFEVVKYLSSQKPEERIAGIAYEDPGKYTKELLGGWTRAVREVMLEYGWHESNFIVHQHEQWGTMHSDVLEVLAQGATGVWAGVCSEGAALGHADSTTTILNLIKVGNTKVQAKFNCKYLRAAAVNVTKTVTGKPPNPSTPIYGERALDMVFGIVFEAIAEGESHAMISFDLATFFGLKPQIRISNMANDQMILAKLIEVFGWSPGFTLKVAQDMKACILDDIRQGIKEEYNSVSGLAMLYERADNTKLTERMSRIIDELTDVDWKIEEIIKKVKERWDFWDAKDGETDDQLTFPNFYKGFMAPYFGCYRCEDSQMGLTVLDMDEDGRIDWFEFKTYLKWAGRQYCDEIQNEQDLLDKAFRFGLMPAMKNQIDDMNRMKQNKKNSRKNAYKKRSAF